MYAFVDDFISLEERQRSEANRSDNEKQLGHSRIDSHYFVDSHNIEVEDNLVYLGTTNDINTASLEIERRNTLANSCIFENSKLNHLVAHIVIPHVPYGSKAWTITISLHGTYAIGYKRSFKVLLDSSINF